MKKANFTPPLPVQSEYKSRRDELFFRLLNGWNTSRKEAGYLPLNAKRLAVALNSNPFLKKDDTALEAIIRECEAKGNYKKAQFILFPKKI